MGGRGALGLPDATLQTGQKKCLQVEKGVRGIRGSVSGVQVVSSDKNL